MNNNKKKIIQMYFIDKLKPVEIAKKLGISKSAVSQVLQRDERYKLERESRKRENKNKHNENTREYIKAQRKSNQFKNKSDDLILTNLHRTASVELSRRRKLSSIAYRNWNTSAYTYNKEKNRFEFREELGRSYDVPKFVKEKI